MISDNLEWLIARCKLSIGKIKRISILILRNPVIFITSQENTFG
jgi:hypothetical protein